MLLTRTVGPYLGIDLCHLHRESHQLEVILQTGNHLGWRIAPLFLPRTNKKLIRRGWGWVGQLVGACRVWLWQNVGVNHVLRLQVYRVYRAPHRLLIILCVSLLCSRVFSDSPSLSQNYFRSEPWTLYCGSPAGPQVSLGSTRSYNNNNMYTTDHS